MREIIFLFQLRIPHGSQTPAPDWLGDDDEGNSFTQPRLKDGFESEPPTDVSYWPIYMRYYSAFITSVGTYTFILQICL